MKKVLGLLPVLSLISMVWGGWYKDQTALDEALEQGATHPVAQSGGMVYERRPPLRSEENHQAKWGSATVVHRDWVAVAAHEVRDIDKKNAFVTLVPDFMERYWESMGFIGRSPYKDDLSSIEPYARHIESIVYAPSSPDADLSTVLAFLKVSEPFDRDYVADILNHDQTDALYKALAGRSTISNRVCGYGYSLLIDQWNQRRSSNLRQDFQDLSWATAQGIRLLQTYQKAFQKRALTPSFLNKGDKKTSLFSLETSFGSLNTGHGLPGDSGGGMFIEVDGTYRLAGIACTANVYQLPGQSFTSRTQYHAIQPALDGVLRKYS